MWPSQQPSLQPTLPVPQSIKLPQASPDLTRFPVTTPQGSIIWATGVFEDEVDKSPRATAPPVISLKITPRNSHKRILIQDQLRSNQISKQLAEQASEPEANTNSRSPLDEGSDHSGVVENAAVRSLTRQNPPRNSANTVAAAAVAVAASSVEKGDEASAHALLHFLIGHGGQRGPEIEEDEATSFTPGKQIMVGYAGNAHRSSGESCTLTLNKNNAREEIARKKPLPPARGEAAAGPKPPASQAESAASPAVSAEAAGGASAGADGGGAPVSERGGGGVGEGTDKKKGAAVKKGKNLWEERIQREKEQKEERQREWDKIRNPER
jgi:hypothetical protein